MAHIDLRRSHGGTLKAAKAAVTRTAAAIGKKFAIDSAWDGDTLHFSRSGVDGRIAVTKSEIHVYAELGFLLGMMKPAIEQEIERQLDKNFG
jgi:putative polyhydroxyalkanoate system protein